MATRGFSLRERKLGLIAGLVMAMWVVLSWIAWPRWERLHELNQRAEISQKKLARLHELAKRKPAIEQAYQTYAAFLTRDPDAAVQRAFLDELEELARAENLQINLKPRPAQPGARGHLISVEVEIDATQQALLAFLDRLLGWSNLVEIERLRISATASSDYPIKANLVIDRVIVKP